MKGPSGCAQMLWRKSLDGYLRQILNARVYDVAVRCTRRFCLVALLSHSKLSYDLTTSSETTTVLGLRQRHTCMLIHRNKRLLSKLHG